MLIKLSIKPFFLSICFLLYFNVSHNRITIYERLVKPSKHHTYFYSTTLVFAVTGIIVPDLYLVCSYSWCHANELIYPLLQHADNGVAKYTMQRPAFSNLTCRKLDVLRIFVAAKFSYLSGIMNIFFFLFYGSKGRTKEGCLHNRHWWYFY